MTTGKSAVWLDFEALAGFGQSGKIHAAHLVDLSLDLPVIIEFFDTPEKVIQILSHLETLVEPNHIVHWQASLIDNWYSTW
jgi:hypothetical protein